MHLITTTGQQATMSSREIADLVGIRHDNVKRTIDTLAQKGVIAFPQTEEKATAGRPAVEYIFAGENGKRDSIVVVAQLSPEFTARLVDRWQALEAQAAAPALDPAKLSRLQLIQIAMDAERERLMLEEKVVEMTPKVAALDRIATADGSLCLMDAAKQLQMRPKDLIAFMSAHQWIYKRAGGSAWIGYQDRIQAGLLEHKSNIVIDGNGVERIRDQVRVTAKGLARLAAIIEKEAA